MLDFEATIPRIKVGSWTAFRPIFDQEYVKQITKCLKYKWRSWMPYYTQWYISNWSLTASGHVAHPTEAGRQTGKQVPVRPPRPATHARDTPATTQDSDSDYWGLFLDF